jgi:hypothetical protein
MRDIPPLAGNSLDKPALYQILRSKQNENEYGNFYINKSDSKKFRVNEVNCSEYQG